MLHTHYSSPKGLDFEGRGRDRVASSTEGDVLRAAIRSRSEAYRTKELLILIGDDFKWLKAQGNYENWERLIKELNPKGRRSSSGIKIFFSTPQRYFAAVAAQRPSLKGRDCPPFYGDLLPYADNRESFWTGFYATRPTLKSLIRSSFAAVHAAQLLFVLARAKLLSDGHTKVLRDWFDALVKSRRNVAIVQHHDAITGTSRANVVEDYERMLREATSKALGVAAAAAAQLLRKSEDSEDEGLPPLSERLGKLFEQPSSSAAATAAAAAARRKAKGEAPPEAYDAPSITPLVVFNPLPTPRCEPLCSYRCAQAMRQYSTSMGHLLLLDCCLRRAWRASRRCQSGRGSACPPLGLATFFVHAGEERRHRPTALLCNPGRLAEADQQLAAPWRLYRCRCWRRVRHAPQASLWLWW